MMGAPRWPPYPQTFGAPRGTRGAPLYPTSLGGVPLLHDFEQLHFEDQRRTRLDLRRRAAITVGGVGGADEPAPPADPHLLPPPRPALRHAASRERAGLPPLDGTVEQPARHPSAPRGPPAPRP